jgi:hypothetical protein
MFNALFLLAHAAEVIIKPGEINPNIPGMTGGGPLDIIGGFYRFALGISGFLALTVIVYGAIKYATNAGNAGNLTDAKEWIYSALLGMLLLSGAYILLNTIGGTQLTNLQLPTLNKIKVSTSTSGPRPLTPGAGTGRYGYHGVAIPTGTYSDEQAWALLQTAGIGRNKPDCQAKGDTNCTSFDGLPEGAVRGIIAIKKGCNCDVVVTAGTEEGHQTHAIAQSIVDLRPNSKLNQYIYAIINTTNPPACANAITGNDGVRYRWETAPQCSDGEHWHVVFP